MNMKSIGLKLMKLEQNEIDRFSPHCSSKPKKGSNFHLWDSATREIRTELASKNCRKSLEKVAGGDPSSSRMLKKNVQKAS